MRCLLRFASTPLAPAADYERHRPKETPLYGIVETYYPQFLARLQADCGSLPAFVKQEFDDYLKCGRLLNLNIHFHMLFLDGAYSFDGSRPMFHRAPRPTPTELDQLLERQGLLMSDPDRDYLDVELGEEKRHKPLAPMSWMQRLQRVFAIDIETCPKCGGKLRVIACIEDPDVIAAILVHIQRREAAETVTAARAAPALGAPRHPIPGQAVLEHRPTLVCGPTQRQPQAIPIGRTPQTTPFGRLFFLCPASCSRAPAPGFPWVPA